MMTRQERILGLLWGMAVGDALGLPRENLSPQRALCLFGGAPLSHRFFGRSGMISDDTEHASLTGQALLASKGELPHFLSSLGWRLRWWFLAAPAGLGGATLRACLRLCFGVSPQNSGVRSAGNGGAMRAPLLGACLAEEPERMRAFVDASTRTTHCDARAREGAFLLAHCVAFVCRQAPDAITPQILLQEMQRHAQGDELKEMLQCVAISFEKGLSASEFAKEMGWEKGVSGYINHTLPAVFFCWLRYWGQFQNAVQEVILLGGDADTTGALVGALAGATLGPDAIPASWLQGIQERPYSLSWLQALAQELALFSTPSSKPAKPVPLAWWWIPPRNFLFWILVISHIFRRFLPPYRESQ